MTWNYFNGTQHGWMGSAAIPMTLAYCAGCGPTHIPGFDASREIGKHWDTGFKQAPWLIGRPCDGCGKSI